MTDTSFTDDIEQLLALERTRSDEPSVMIDRLRDRLSMTLGLDGALEHALESAKSGADASHAASGASRATATASTAGAGALTGTKIALVALGAFAVGAVSGAKWQSGRSEPPPSDNVPSVVAPTATATHAASVAPSASVLASADAGIAVDISSLPLVKPSAPTATMEPSAPSKDGRDPLGAERTLIDVARTASSRGKMAEAMTALDEHASRFPRGALSEEREGLRIQLLIAEGRTTEARTRAASFRKSFPTSLMLPAIDAQLGPASAASAGPTPSTP